MSLPTALLVSRYRAFAGEETLPLRPLTLIFGRNNAGKSALARALALIEASVAEDAGSALVTPPELIRDGTFSDLAWQGDAGDYSFDFGLAWGTGELREARYTFDGGSGRAPYVKELVLRGANRQVLWSGRAAPGRSMRSTNTSEDNEVRFVGLVPRDTEVSALRELASHMSAIRGQVQWIDGVRARPRRSISRTGTAPTRMTSNGSNAAEFLVESPDLIDSIRRFYAKLEPSRDFEVKEILESSHQITLSPADQPSFRIDLEDTGEGMAQVLPVLVAATLAERRAAGSILVVEEPESHLHPDAQAKLADYLCTIAATSAPPTLVLETHSRVFLLSVQLAIATGRLAPERVGLVWVEQDASGRSTITPVKFASSGHPQGGWPVAALAEDLRLAGELAQVGMQRQG